MRWLRSFSPLSLLCLACLLVQLGGGLRWIAATWSDPTYGSAGLLPLLLLLPTLRRLPPARPEPSRRHLGYLVLLAGADLLLLQPLEINVLRAAAAVVCLHLWLVTFRDYRGRWHGHPQLWLGLACLPVVHWGNALVGYPLQQLAARIAGGALSLVYGVPATVDGTQLRIGQLLIAVDSTCSGLKLLYCGALFGLLATAATGGRLTLGRGAAFWASLLGLLFSANVLRVLCLTLAQLFTGQAPGETLHQAIGLTAFVLVAALPSLLLLRRLATARTGPTPDPPTPPAGRGRLALDPRLALPSLALLAAVSCAAPRRAVRIDGPPGPNLPARIAGEAARRLPLGPSEQLLARSPRVTLQRRAYGATQVALVRVRGGIKELHPPSVCLEAAGFEIVSRRQVDAGGGGCLTAMTVRDKKQRLLHFRAAYLTDGPGERHVGCSYAGQTGRAIWRRLTRQATGAAALQVLDANPARARAVTAALLRHLLRDGSNETR